MTPNDPIRRAARGSVWRVLPVCAPPKECLVCGHAMVAMRWTEDALLRHGGYGGSRTTEVVACPARGCLYRYSLTVMTERPPRCTRPHV